MAARGVHREQSQRARLHGLFVQFFGEREATFDHHRGGRDFGVIEQRERDLELAQPSTGRWRTERRSSRRHCA